MTSLLYEQLPVKNKIVRINAKFSKYEAQLSQLSWASISSLSVGELEKTYNISNHYDAEEILKIIKQIISYEKSLENKNYKIIREAYVRKMENELNLRNKTKRDLRIECSNLDCHDINGRDCEPLKRIEVILDVYKQLIENPGLWQKISFGSVLKIDHKYGHQQMMDDFLHVHIIHCQSPIKHKPSLSNGIYGIYMYDKISIKQTISKKFHCKDITQCQPVQRHYRERNEDEETERNYYERQFGTLHRTKSIEIINEKDAVFQQDCDKIHAYFLHEINPDASRYNQYEMQENKEEINQNPRRLLMRQMSQHEVEKKVDIKTIQYIGKKEDEKWWSKIKIGTESKQPPAAIYGILVKNTGAFRWQSAHGFRVGENSVIGHLKQRHSNIKEEALYNRYHPLTKDNWNQTLRKSKIFHQSWARQKIRTMCNGYFDDRVTGEFVQWKQGAEVTLQEIVILKLYTDFDKLQFALKKCFRYESVHDIIQRNKQNVINNKNNFCTYPWWVKLEEKKWDLERRIEEFFHWRCGLLIVLNKFGTKLKNKNMILYHGVNTKMIIRPTETFGFYGPLSTTSSPHVARTFATAKGMVLKIKSHFPRLNYCNAFDASLISDYPEEQEWLIGFMYVRVLEVRTRNLIDNPKSWKDIFTNVPIASWMRAEFFAIHLFREQMFSMSEHLERMQAQYLRTNRKECCDEKAKEKYAKDGINDHDWGDRLDCLCYFAAKHYGDAGVKKKEKEIEEKKKEENFKWSQTVNDQDSIDRKKKVYPVFWDKFNYFRKHPNESQSIKFDIISHILKRFFMRPIDEIDINTKQKKWIISFDEIIKVYPNAKEIHFFNQYKFDDHVLKRLVEQIKKTNNSVKKVTFSYYDYIKNNSQGMPLNDMIFTNPKHLKHELLNGNVLNIKTVDGLSSEWEIKYGKNGDTGYKISVSKND